MDVRMGQQTIATKNVRVFTPRGDHETGRMVVWWHGGIEKNNKDNSVPLVVVFFRKIYDDGRFGPFVSRPIALTALGLIPLGSIVEDGHRVADLYFDTNNFEVDFTMGSWNFVSPYEESIANRPNPINQSDYKLCYNNDKNWLLNFPLTEGKSLIIPCMVFYTRVYGRSAEVKRVLATYPWEDAQPRLYLPITHAITPGGWAVKLHRRMTNSDVVFLAHIKYDQYANKAAREIYAQIESGHLNQNNNSRPNKEAHTFIKARPWFQGAAKIKVKGTWINGGKTYLALRIVGVSDPSGVPIERDRENTNKADAPAPEENKGKAWAGVPERNIKIPEIINLTDAEAPDGDSSSIEIEEDEFEVIGPSRVVIDTRRSQAESSSGKPSDGGDPDSYSTGETYGSGKKVGHGSIHTPQVMESQGVLRDMWNAMLHAKKEQPELIKAVEWFTFEVGFSSIEEPMLISLEPFDANEKVEIDVRNWLYFDVKNKLPRGVLIAKIKTPKHDVYIIEIQRRIKPGIKQQGKREELLRGVVFILDEGDDFTLLLSSLLSSIRHIKGVVQKLEGKYFNKSWTFKHAKSREESAPCTAALKNALSKTGVVLNTKGNREK